MLCSSCNAPVIEIEGETCEPARVRAIVYTEAGPEIRRVHVIHQCKPTEATSTEKGGVGE